MFRISFFFLIIILPVIFSWWLFIPLALLYVCLAKFPYEMILAGFMLDMIYYFGNGFLWEHLLALFSASLIILAFFINKIIRWPKVI